MNKQIGFGDIQYGGNIANGDERSVWLYHSCDEWVIGGVEELKRFIKNAQKMLEYLESTDKKQSNG